MLLSSPIVTATLNLFIRRESNSEGEMRKLGIVTGVKLKSKKKSKGQTDKDFPATDNIRILSVSRGEAECLRINLCFAVKF